MIIRVPKEKVALSTGMTWFFGIVNFGDVFPLLLPEANPIRKTMLGYGEKIMLIRYILLALMLPALGAAQVDKFLIRTFKGSSGLVLPYRLFVPKIDPAAHAQPLVLVLHGAGEKGNNNTAQMTANQLATVWAVDSNQAKYPSFVVAPQCPANGSWVYANFQNGTYDQSQTALSNELRTVLELLDSLGREYKLDPDRLYLAGLSMGGFGTWDLITRFPDKFAAAVPICGAGDTTKAPLIKNLPIWAFHGSIDPTVPVAGSRLMIAALKKAGGKPEYTEYPGVGHESWVPALKEPGLLPWVFAQKRAGASRLVLRSRNHFASEASVASTAFRPDGKRIHLTGNDFRLLVR